MKKLVALGLVGLALAGCAGEPVWNNSVFPPVPEYGTTTSAAAPAPVTAEAKK